MKLKIDTVAPYLKDHGIVPPDADSTVESLGGGVSNVVLRVDWEDDAVVVKQPFSNLAVDDDWPADVGRVHNEAAGAQVYGNVLVEDEFDEVVENEFDDVTVPGVRLEDREDHIIVIDAAPPSANMWKADLLEGTVDAGIAERVGRFLAAAHRFGAIEKGIRGKFSNYTPFEQLRLDPYHRTVMERHPDVAPAIEAEIDRIRSTRETLVHGDYSPKNVLVDERGGHDRVWLLDFEVAHWGDPTFDVAFMLNHLFIKSVYNADRLAEYVSTAASFWETYRATADVGRAFESNVVGELAILMLARVDGKSPVEYLKRESTKSELRILAKNTIRGDATSVDAFVSTLRSHARTT